jgi:hypothetical protein
VGIVALVGNLVNMIFVLFCCLLLTISNAFIKPFKSSVTLKQFVPNFETRPRIMKLRGTEDIVQAFSAAFMGGTIGVMSVAIIVELRKAVDRNLEDCPYCMGNGEILCGMCCGSKRKGQQECPSCGGRGLVTCLNCKGDGRITPLILQSRATRDPVRMNVFN